MSHGLQLRIFIIFFISGLIAADLRTYTTGRVVMLMLKVMNAISDSGKIILPDRHPETRRTRCFCISCGCPLLIRHEGYSGAWFEHDQAAISAKQLMACVYYDGKNKRNKRDELLHNVISQLGPVVPVTRWHCTQCKSDYTGKKHCHSCNTGIFSIVATAPHTD